MVHKNLIELRDKVVGLRKNGLSYREINAQTNVPKSTLSLWFKNESYSDKVKEQLLKKYKLTVNKRVRRMAVANKKRWKNIHKEYREVARIEFVPKSQDHLFLVGLAIYWGEGDKRLYNCNVRVSNIDPRLLRIFLDFLLKCCDIRKEKIRLSLLLYPDLRERDCKEFWSKSLNIPLENFHKSQYIKGRKNKDKLSYGVCSVVYTSRELKEKIIEWICLLDKKI